MHLRKLAAGAADDADEDGIEETFSFLEEFNDQINSGLWISPDCFVYVTPKGTLNYLIGTKILKHTTVDKKYFVFGYDSKQNRLYLIDKSLNMISSTLLFPLVNF